MRAAKAAAVIWISVVAGLAGPACGQDYPLKPIRILTGSVGGVNDFVARLIAQGITAPLEQNVIVENRPSNLVGEIAARAPADGYTLLVAGGTFVIGPLLQKTPYDPVKDFAPITLAVSSPNILIVHPSLPVRSVKELIALARARPGQLNYASGNSGSANHLAAELFKSMAKVDIVRVPYKGGGPAVTDLVGGHVQLMFSSMSAVAPHVTSGRLRALAVTSAKPSSLAPGLVTVADSGLPGYESASTQGVYAPARTPAAIINRLNQEIVRSISRPELKERLLAAGVEAAPTSPAQFAAIIKADIVNLGKVIREAGIKGE